MKNERQATAKRRKSTLQWLGEFAAGHRGNYLASVLAAVLGVLLGLAPYVCIARIVQLLIDGNRDFAVYGRICGIMALFWIGRVLCHALSTTLSHKTTFAVLGEVRKRVCDKLARLPLGTVQDLSSGSLKNTVVERIDSIETVLAHIVPEFTANLVSPLVLAVAIFVIDWRMGLTSLLTIPVGLICYAGMMRGYEADFKNTVDKTKALNDTAVEYIGGIEVIKAFGKAEQSYDRFVVAAREGASCFVDWMRRCNGYFTAAMAIMPASLVAILPVGGLLFRAGSLSAADFILIIILSFGTLTPLITVMSYSDDLAQMGTIVGEVSAILEQDEQHRPAVLTTPLDGRDVVLTDVTFGYHDAEVLHGISMTMAAGTVNAIVGPSGSGKSTLAKLIASLWDADGGRITIGGVDIRAIPPADYHRLVAYVSQDNFLFDDTIRENIRMGRAGATDDEVIAVAKASGCHDFITGLEHGYDTVVGDAGGALSGGERQRIAIARAMLKDAPIVILDEATAYTDPENEAVIQAAVGRLVKGKTLIVIAHRLSTIADSDQIFVIKDGRLDSCGTHKTLLAENGLYRQMWEAHISVRDRLDAGDDQEGDEAHA
ncbi:ABC transporter ATP-binding protein [Pseudoramibacter faecis]|uniref:ABC transporter ATP-binding protein n=1 Tax=Pseudoramibacter faecis TaxID=3108534 RepID=UPI002E791FCB|nr:ABC transporter ATP-binding protein [Pseudoramibacter sp. HA2172]